MNLPNIKILWLTAFALFLLCSPRWAETFTPILVIEAENATIKTVGQAINGGWCLSSRGTLADNVRIPAAGTYMVVVRAYGSPLGGIWPLMALTVNGLAEQTVTVDSAGFRDYPFRVELTPGVHLIGVSFLNDAYNPGVEDRNLYLDKFTIASPPGIAKPELDGVKIPSRSPDDIVPSTFFGMHIHRAGSSTPWPAVPFGTWRLWDAGVIWPLLEPNKGEWHFEKLDTTVNLAEAHNVEILITLGGSPTWASARPAESSPYSPGAAAEPANIEDWKNYVRTVSTRYKGRIRYYEIWNEPNLSSCYSGTADHMVTLAREAYKILKEVDPTVKVVSPSVTGAYGIPWLDQYFIKGGAAYADIIGYHFYVFPDPPEAMVPVIKNVRQIMTKYGISNKPLWNTEAGWAKPKFFPLDSEASAYVARSYILNWAAGIDRFYWYAWDNHNWVTLEMTQTDNKTLKPAAIAYREVQKWIVGAKILPCEQDSQGTWLAKITRENAYKGFIIWNPDKTINFEIPKEWNVKQMKDLTGSRTHMTGARQLSIGIGPILLENSFGSPPINPPQNLKVIY